MADFEDVDKKIEALADAVAKEVTKYYQKFPHSSERPDYLRVSVTERGVSMSAPRDRYETPGIFESFSEQPGGVSLSSVDEINLTSSIQHAADDLWCNVPRGSRSFAFSCNLVAYMTRTDGVVKAEDIKKTVLGIERHNIHRSIVRINEAVPEEGELLNWVVLDTKSRLQLIYVSADTAENAAKKVVAALSVSGVQPEMKNLRLSLLEDENIFDLATRPVTAHDDDYDRGIG